MSTVMKRLAWVLALIGLVVVGDRVIARGLQKVVLSTENRFAVLYRGGVPDDAVLIFGDSRSVDSFHAPSLSEGLGRPVFNLGNNGTSISIIEILLEDYLERNGKPSLVVIEASCVRQSHEQIQDLLPFATTSDRVGLFADRVLPDDLVRARQVSDLYNFNGETLVRAIGTFGKSDQGYAPGKRISAQALAEAQGDYVDTINLRPENLDALERLTAMLRSEGIEYRLVIAPYLPAYRPKIENFDAFVRAVSEAADAPVWDFSNALTQTDAFADRVHPNRTGARLLVPILIERGLFEPGGAPLATGPSDG